MTRARDLADLGGAADAGTVAGTNLIINGDMAVHQRGGTITAGSGIYSLDRWQIWASGDGGFDVTQSTEAPVGFKNSLKVDVTSADTSIDAGAYKLLYHTFEGYNMSHLEWGTANAKTVTISFWVRSTTTGDHSVGIRGGDSSYNSYMTTYNISSANTWEYKTVTISGDTTASFTYNSNNAVWGTLVFSFATGSTFTVTANETFETGNLISATGAVNLFSSASNDWYLTGVKLEVGSTATPFLHESYDENLAKCQRYYQKDWYKGGGAISVGHAWAATRAMADISFSGGQMRTSPTITLPTAGQGANVMTFLNSGSAYPTTTGTHSVQGVSNINFRLDATGYAGLTTGSASWLYSGSSLGNVYFEYDAEL